MTHRTPRWNYFVSPEKTPVQKDHSKWTTPIPLGRHQAGQPLGITGNAAFSYGDYFLAAHNFLQQNRLEMLTDALSRHLNQQIKSEDIEEISIGIEKHGEFYHPAKIDVVLPDTTTSLVLNVAVSENGKNIIRREYALLQKLHTELPFSFVPKVYEQGQVETKNNIKLPMFIGEWLEGFNEFHISLDSQDNRHKIVVWDPENGPFFLTTEQTFELYQQAAMILTGYYNLETFEQISPWHHAAGDFVIRIVNSKLTVKLVSVKNYVSLVKANEVDDGKRDIHFILNALLAFFLNLTMRMRLDRLDGIGNLVWAADISVKGTLQGFFKGLELRPSPDRLPDTIGNCFRAYLFSLDLKDLADLCFAIADSYNPKAPEVPVIKKNLQKHAKSLYETIQETAPNQ
jgi:hypothetical protein